jgi:hypothetical protein
MICSLQTSLLDQWTQYLIQDSLVPQNQLSTDDFAGSLSNQTNLAIKGLVGIKAMSVIEGLLGNSAKSSNYSVCRPILLLLDLTCLPSLLAHRALPPVTSRSLRSMLQRHLASISDLPTRLTAHGAW